MYVETMLQLLSRNVQKINELLTSENRSFVKVDLMNCGRCMLANVSKFNEPP